MSAVFFITALSCSGPNCSDGIQNGDETDIDCGGTCPACPVSISSLEQSLEGTWQLDSSVTTNSFGSFTDTFSGSTNCQIQFTLDIAGDNGTGFHMYHSFGIINGCGYPTHGSWYIDEYSDYLINMFIIQSVTSTHLVLDAVGYDINYYYHKL